MFSRYLLITTGIVYIKSGDVSKKDVIKVSVFQTFFACPISQSFHKNKFGLVFCLGWESLLCYLVYFSVVRRDKGKLFRHHYAPVKKFCHHFSGCPGSKQKME